MKSPRLFCLFTAIAMGVLAAALPLVRAAQALPDGGETAAAHRLRVEKPTDNVNPVRHPNLAAAQQLLIRAFDRVTAAQKDNDFHLGGHAERAKELIDRASAELKLAAEAANEHRQESARASQQP